GLVRAVQLAFHEGAESGCQGALGVVGGREAAQGFPGRFAAFCELAADGAELGDLEEELKLAAGAGLAVWGGLAVCAGLAVWAGRSGRHDLQRRLKPVRRRG